MKKATSILLILTMLLTFVPMALAEDVPAETNPVELKILNENINISQQAYLFVNDEVTVSGVVTDSENVNIENVEGTITLEDGKGNNIEIYAIDDGEESENNEAKIYNPENGSFQFAFKAPSNTSMPYTPNLKIVFTPVDSKSYTVAESEPISFSIYYGVDYPTIGKTEFEYTGKETKLVPDSAGYTVTGGTAAAIGEYQATIKPSSSYIWKDEELDPKYEGNVKWSIVQKDLANCNIAAIPTQTYTGGEIKPDITVTNGDTVLTAGTDYNVEYLNNTSVGTATVKITAPETSKNYTGSKEATFTIDNAKVALYASVSPSTINSLTGGTLTISGSYTPANVTGKIYIEQGGQHFAHKDNVSGGDFNIAVNIPEGSAPGTFSLDIQFNPEEGSPYSGSGATKSYTVYTPNVEITFDAGDGKCDVKTAKTGNDGKLSSLPTATKEGSDGQPTVQNTKWVDEKGNTVSTSTVITEPCTLTAVYPNIYTVIFEDNGERLYDPQYVIEGNKVTKPADPTKEKYDFNYWKDEDGKEFDFTTIIKSDMTLTADWAKQYCLTVVSADSSMGSVTPEEYYLSEGKKVEITATGKDRYIFTEWDVQDIEGSKVASTTSSTTTFTMGKGDTKVTANFETGYKVYAKPEIDSSKATFTVKYNPTKSGNANAITITPKPGYIIDKVTAVTADNRKTVDLTKVDTNNYTFTMPSNPAEDVEVNVSLKEGYTITLVKSSSYPKGDLYWGYTQEQALNKENVVLAGTSNKVDIPIEKGETLYIYSIPNTSTTSSTYYTNHSTLTAGYWTSTATDNLYTVTSISGDMTITISYKTTAQTGDSSSLPYIIAMIAAAAVGTGIIIKTRKKRT